MENQQRPTVQHKELDSMLRGSLDGRGVWGRMDICICMAESLCCLPEIITLLIGYTPIQNKKFKKNPLCGEGRVPHCILNREVCSYPENKKQSTLTHFEDWSSLQERCSGEK